jgi:hypothetical protein
MEQGSTTLSAQEIAFELARWYHDLARLCVQAAEQHVTLSENSELADMERALAINDVIRVRMATVQSIESGFRTEFPRLYVDHQVERILSLDTE